MDTSADLAVPCCFQDSFDGHAAPAYHQTDSIDYDTVLSGSMTLILDDGEHELEPGDCIVVTGVGRLERER